MRLAFDDCVVDLGTRQLFREGREVSLPPKPFHLLEMLLAARPEVVSNEELRARLWPDAVVSKNNLAVLVSEVRAAIGDSLHKPLIRTVHGYGYSFCGHAAEAKGLDDRDDRKSMFELIWPAHSVSLFQGDNLIGRAPGASIFVDDPSVSRRHARIHVLGKDATLEDLDSTNGTFLGGARVGGPSALYHGAEIKVGSVRIVFRVAGSQGDRITAKVAGKASPARGLAVRDGRLGSRSTGRSSRAAE